MNRYEQYLWDKEQAGVKERAAAALAGIIGGQGQAARAKTMTWTTRDGRSIPIIDMTNEHLMNSIALCEKNGWFKSRVGFLKIEARRRGLL